MGSKPTILHFTHSFFPVMGGTTTRNFNLMDDAEFRHEVIAPQAPCGYIPPHMGRLNEQDRYGNVGVRRVVLTPDLSERSDLVSKMPYSFRYIADVKARARRLLEGAQGLRGDIVYGHSPLEFAWAAYRHAKSHGLPLIYEAHGFLSNRNLEGRALTGQSGLKRFASRLPGLGESCERTVIRHASYVVSQTSTVSIRFQREFGIPESRILEIVNGVDTNRFQRTPETRAYNPYRNPGLEGMFVLLYSGFLNDINGVDFLLRAMAALPEGLKTRVHLLVAGRGPLQAEVEAAAFRNKNITFLGLVPYDAMPRLYEACDLFVIPRPPLTDAEEFYPMKLLEAMSMEQTVLVSDVGPMAEIVNDGMTGFLYRKGDMADFLNKLAMIVQFGTHAAAVGKAAREHVLKKFQWKHSRAILNEKYRELLGHRHPSHTE